MTAEQVQFLSGARQALAVVIDLMADVEVLIDAVEAIMS